jgi:hypothetical protein
MKQERINFGEFMRGEYRQPSRLEDHFRNHGFAYKVAGSAAVLLVTGVDVSFAAGSVIDAKANVLYYKLLDIGKWIIIFKGGLDTIKSVGAGDFDSAKKHFFSYLLVYLLLLGLPFGMEEVDKLFADLKRS